jgi:hypothetical protein
VTPIDASRLIEEKLAAASGKSVLMQRDPNCSGHASIKIASDEDSAHVLRYMPKHKSEIPYLSAFQCGLAFRSIQAKTVNRLDLTSTPAMGQEVKRLIEDHFQNIGSPVPMSMIPQLFQQFGHGLGLQVRSMPIAIRVDDWLFRDYSALADRQRKSIERQLQEAMHALGPSVRAFLAQIIIDAIIGASCAFAKFWAKSWNEPEVESVHFSGLW